MLLVGSRPIKVGECRISRRTGKGKTNENFECFIRYWCKAEDLPGILKEIEVEEWEKQREI